MRISDWSSDVCSSDLRPRIEDDCLAVADQRRGGAADAALFVHIFVMLEREGAHLLRHRFQKGAAMLADDMPLGLQFLEILPHRQIGRASCRERVCQYV